MLQRIREKYLLVLPAAAVVAAVIGLKLVAHRMGWEVISLNPLFSGIVAANVFLLGFLLSGVLADYKESERLPGELAASLDALMDEASVLYERSSSPAPLALMHATGELATAIRAWFFREERTSAVMDRVDGLSRPLADLESVAPANYVVRLKQEQQTVRRMLIRIHTVRETSFVSSGYLIAELTSLLLAAGLVLVRIDPFLESLFFVGVIMFLMSYLIFMIRDLDNPFGYYERRSGEDVSLKPLEDILGRIRARLRAVSDENATSTPPA